MQAFLGFISGRLIAWFYNIIAEKLGGIEFEFEDNKSHLLNDLPVEQFKS